MDDLGFTQTEKDWKDMVEQLFGDYIMGYVLSGGSMS